VSTAFFFLSLVSESEVASMSQMLQSLCRMLVIRMPRHVLLEPL
jgi:hypothetical protein